MKLQKFGIYLADLNPRRGTEPGKVRPVVILQSNLLNDTHFSTIVCPVTTGVVRQAELLRVHVAAKDSGLEKDSDILVDQIRAIDNRRFLKRVGKLSLRHQEKLLQNLHMLIFE